MLFTLPALPLPAGSGLKLGGVVSLEAVLARVLRGAAAGHDLVLRRRGQRAGQRPAAAALRPGRALRDRRRLRGRADVRTAAGHRRRPGPRPPTGCAARRPRGLGASRGSAMPVLEGALERSVELAAAMDARGYGRTTDAGRRPRRLTGALRVRRSARRVRRHLRPARRHRVGLARACRCWSAAPSWPAAGLCRRRTPDRPHQVPPRPVGAARSGWSPAPAWSRPPRCSSTSHRPRGRFFLASAADSAHRCRCWRCAGILRRRCCPPVLAACRQPRRARPGRRPAGRHAWRWRR